MVDALAELRVHETPGIRVLNEMDHLLPWQHEVIEIFVRALLPDSFFSSPTRPAGLEALRARLPELKRVAHTVAEFREPAAAERTPVEFYRRGEELDQQADEEKILGPARVSAEMARRARALLGR